MKIFGKNNRIEDALFSLNEHQVLEALYTIGGGNCDVSERARNRVLELLNSSNEDIRSRAAFVAAVHCKWEESCDLIISMITSNQETSHWVLQTLCSGLGVLGRTFSSKRDACIQNLARVASNEQHHPKTRGTAYVELLALMGKISVAEYASAPDNILSMEVDQELLQRCTR